MTRHHLFVYGTLMPGERHAQELADVPGSWQRARVRGVLHQDCWGPAQGYPCLQLDAQADWVNGYVLTSEALAAHWSHLDVFEGEGYVRRLAAVQCESGEWLDAQIYVVATDQPDS